MKKMLFYGMEGKKMCFLHLLMNALQMEAKGYEVAIIFEGESVKLPSVLAEEENPLYLKAIDKGIVAGVCKACSKMMEVLAKNEALGLTLLDDMNGHAGMEKYVAAGYDVMVF